MPQFQYISDIHLELWAINPAFYQVILKPSAPYLILAGDICSYNKKAKLQPLLEYCSNNFEKTFMVGGNHEYYAYKTPMSKVEQWLQESCSAFPNIHYLQQDTYLLEDKYTIIGCTLWTDIPPEMDGEVIQCLNDFSQITNDDGSAFRPINMRQLFQTHVKWLDAAITSANDNQKTPIVITHHLPSPTLTDHRYKEHPLNCCFSSPVLEQLHNQPAAWFYGHSHVDSVQTFNNTTCYINALGYPGERKEPPEPTIAKLA
jgi:predicted phosphodiesterase